MAGSTGGVFPDLPRMPRLPHLRRHVSVKVVLAEAELVVRAARDAVHQVEHCSRPGQQLAQIRSAVIDIRRVTFVLQTLRSRVDHFDSWYVEVQGTLRADPLMKYFVDLRNEIEKCGLPGAVAELYDATTGTAVADVACYEDQYGLAVSGAARQDVDLPPGELTGSYGLRNFRLPDPPTLHNGQQLTDLRFATLAGLALDFLEVQAVVPARSRFGGLGHQLGFADVCAGLVFRSEPDAGPRAAIRMLVQRQWISLVIQDAFCCSRVCSFAASRRELFYLGVRFVVSYCNSMCKRGRRRRSPSCASCNWAGSQYSDSPAATQRCGFSSLMSNLPSAAYPRRGRALARPDCLPIRVSNVQQVHQIRCEAIDPPN